MTLYYVVDPNTGECEGEIEPDNDTSAEILEALENSDYILGADDHRLVPRPDGEWAVVDTDADTVLFLDLSDPDDPDTDEDEDDTDDESDEDADD